MKVQNKCLSEFREMYSIFIYAAVGWELCLKIIGFDDLLDVIDLYV